MTIGVEELPVGGVLLPGVVSAGADQWVNAPDLSLVFSADGIRVQATGPPSERLLEWCVIETAWIGENVTLTDGRTAAILELWSAGERLQFLLASDRVDPVQVAYLRQAIPMWLNRYKGAPPPRAGAEGTAHVAAAVAAIAGGATEVATSPVESAGFAYVPSQPSPMPDYPSPTDVPEENALSEWSVPPVTDAVDTKAPSGSTYAFSAVTEPVPPVTALPSVDPAPPRSPTDGRVRKWRVGVVVIVVVAVVLIGTVVYLLAKPASSSTGAPLAAVALATSINVRLSDLPPGWDQASVPSVIPPPAPAEARLKAAETLAACVRQPVNVVEGWFGTKAFPGQIAGVTSPTFQTVSAPTGQILSSTRVLGSTGKSQRLAAPFEASNFATCFGQYQAAAAAPVTAQVQMETPSAPRGVKVYAYSTTFTLPNQATSVVEDAFIIGGRTATVLQSSSPVATMTASDFATAYRAVVGRVAKAAG